MAPSMDQPLMPCQRPAREWSFLVLSLALVCAICIPLWQGTAAERASGEPAPQWTPERLGRLLLGPEQAVCYACFLWAGFLLAGRWWEVGRQRRAFGLDLLPTEGGIRILPEDARGYQRKIEQTPGCEGFLLAHMIRLALGRFAVTRSGQDVGETVRTQAEGDMSRLVTSMRTIHALAWAIPAAGFVGTIRGLAGGVMMAAAMDQETGPFIEQASRGLALAFDCTLVALVLSLVLLFALQTVQRREESLVLDCRQYCLELLVNRLYEPEPVQEFAA